MDNEKNKYQKTGDIISGISSFLPGAGPVVGGIASTILNNIPTGYSPVKENESAFANGGNFKKDLFPSGMDKKLNKDTFKVGYKGSKVDNKKYGNIYLDKNEIVDNKTGNIYSDKLSYKGKTFAKMEEKIQKFKGSNNEFMNKDLLDIMSRRNFQRQEALKPNNSTQTKFSGGGNPYRTFSDFYKDRYSSEDLKSGISNFQTWTQQFDDPNVHPVDNIDGIKTKALWKTYGDQYIKSLRPDAVTPLPTQINPLPTSIDNSIPYNNTLGGIKDKSNHNYKVNDFLKNNVGDLLQLGEIGGKFLGTLKPADREIPHFRRNYQLSDDAVQKAAAQALNAGITGVNTFRPSSRNAMLAQMQASNVKNLSNSLNDIQNKNISLAASTDAFNQAERSRISDLNDRNRAALDSARQVALESLGNTGRALNDRKQNQSSQDMLYSVFPLIEKFYRDDLEKMAEKRKTKRNS